MESVRQGNRTTQRCGRAAACSAEAAGAGLHRRGGRGEAAAVPEP